MKKKGKREQRNKLIIGAIMVVVLITSMGSVLLYYGSDVNKFSEKHNGVDYVFELRQDSLGTQYYEVKSKTASFTTFSPPSYILSPGDDEKNMLKSLNVFYLSFNPNATDLSYIDYLRYDLRKNMPQSKAFVEAVTLPGSVYDFPVVSCANSSPSVPVVVLEMTNRSNIQMTGNCLTWEFSPYEIFRVRDTLLYSMYNIEVG